MCVLRHPSISSQGLLRPKKVTHLVHLKGARAIAVGAAGRTNVCIVRLPERSHSLTTGTFEHNHLQLRQNLSPPSDNSYYPY